MENKNLEELEILKFLKNNIINFPSGETNISERPDFIIASNSTKLGIEVTQLHKLLDKSNPESKSNESTRNKIVETIKNKLSEKNVGDLKIFIFFSNTNQDFRLNREDFSNRIVEIILSNIPDLSTSVDITHMDKIGSDLPYEIDTVRIFNLKSDNSLEIVHPIVGWVQEDFRNELQSIISKKNEKFDIYINNCDDCWLLVYSTWQDASSFLDPNKETIKKKYNSKFSRTFYIGGMPRKCFELST